MRTTLDLDDHLLHEARKKAAAEGRTLTALIEEALRLLLGRRGRKRAAHRLRWVTRSGPAAPGVDLADRGALYERMEDRGSPKFATAW